MDPENTTEQPETDSVEDRIARQFEEGSAETEESPEGQEAASEEGTAEPETFEFEQDGEKFVLPKKLEKAILQEKDYTQKSQSLAEQRKALDLVHEQHKIAALAQAFQQEVGPDLQQLHMLETVINQARAADWSQMSTDDLLRKRLEIDNLSDQRQKLYEKVEGRRQEWTQKQAQEFESIKTKSLDAIKKRIPGWNEEMAKVIREHAVSEGYTEAELASIIDPRHAVTLWKAQQFDKLQAQAKPAVQGAKSIKTSPSNPMPQDVKARLNYRKNIGRVTPGTPEHKKLVDSRLRQVFG